MFQNTIKTILLLFASLYLTVNETQCCGVGSSIGYDSVKIFGDYMIFTERELSKTAKKLERELLTEIERVSERLAEAANNGVEAAKEAVRDMSGAVDNLAKKVSVQFDSGDLKYIGQRAAQQLKDGLVGLSRNWKLVMDTADLKDVGATAAMHLSEALEKINIHFTLKIEFGQEVVKSVKYVSFAIGGAFGVLFFSIVVCLGTRLHCCDNLKNSFSNRVNNKYSQYSNYQTPKQRGVEVVFTENTAERGFQGTQANYNTRQMYEPLLKQSQKESNSKNNSTGMHYGTCNRDDSQNKV